MKDTRWASYGCLSWVRNPGFEVWPKFAFEVCCAVPAMRAAHILSSVRWSIHPAGWPWKSIFLSKCLATWPYGVPKWANPRNLGLFMALYRRAARDTHTHTHSKFSQLSYELFKCAYEPFKCATWLYNKYVLIFSKTLFYTHIQRYTAVAGTKCYQTM